MTQSVILHWSGGKDAALALHHLRQDPRYRVAGLFTTLSGRPPRVAQHEVAGALLARQADALQLPWYHLHFDQTPTNAEYEAQLQNWLQQPPWQGQVLMAFGDIYLTEVREYREALWRRLGFSCLFPLWGRPTAALLEAFFVANFRAEVVSVMEPLLTAAHCGRSLDRSFLESLPPGADPCGEQGEYHSFVYDGPGFARPVAYSTGALRQKRLPRPDASGELTLHYRPLREGG